eukprot:4980332-Ditylum_brightwellii.AAC.1
MQCIKAVVLSSSNMLHTVKCNVLHYPCNKWPTLTGSWQTTHHSDLTDVKPLGGDVAGGI